MKKTIFSLQKYITPAFSAPVRDDSILNHNYRQVRKLADTVRFIRLSGSILKKSGQRSVFARPDRAVKIFVAINTFPQPSGWSSWQDSIDHASEVHVIRSM